MSACATAVHRGALAFAVSGIAAGQALRRKYKIAVLNEASETVRSADFTFFRRALRDTGLEESRNLAIDIRHAEGSTERLNRFAGELVAAKPDLIVATDPRATRAAMDATRTIPIVFWSSSDPVAAGFVASLARPGGNVTGVSSVADEIQLKAYDLLRELVPNAQRIAYLGDAAALTGYSFSRVADRAQSQHIELHRLFGARRDHLDRAFETISREKIQGLLVAAGAGLLQQGEEILRHATREKLPTVYNGLEWSKLGGLVSIGADKDMRLQRAAAIVNRILHGAKPSDTAVEQVDRIHIVVNRKIARATGIMIPQTILLRADDIIE